MIIIHYVFISERKHVVIGQKDGYVHRLTRAFTRQ
jgi:hypothetical protein